MKFLKSKASKFVVTTALALSLFTVPVLAGFGDFPSADTPAADTPATTNDNIQQPAANTNSSLPDNTTTAKGNPKTFDATQAGQLVILTLACGAVCVFSVKRVRENA